MIDVDYNEYKKILEQNMKLIPENHKLKEEIEKLKNIISKAIEYNEGCMNNMLDLETISEDERKEYLATYEIHNKNLEILKKKGEEIGD
jgi:hypothetical protein